MQQSKESAEQNNLYFWVKGSVLLLLLLLLLHVKVSEYDQEMPKSHNADEGASS